MKFLYHWKVVAYDCPGGSAYNIVEVAIFATNEQEALAKAAKLIKRGIYHVRSIIESFDIYTTQEHIAKASETIADDTKQPWEREDDDES
jgi:hypothetical protein